MSAKLVNPKLAMKRQEERTCGECTLCCKVMPILDPKVPSLGGQWCSQCKIGVGCQIYDDRPLECREYLCLWRQGILPDDCRPDKCGAVFSIRADGAFDRNGDPFPIYVVHPRTEYMLNPMARELVISILHEWLPVILMGRNTGCWAYMYRKALRFTDRREIVNGKLDSFADHEVVNLPWRNLFDLMGLPLEMRKTFFHQKKEPQDVTVRQETIRPTQ